MSKCAPGFTKKKLNVADISEDTNDNDIDLYTKYVYFNNKNNEDIPVVDIDKYNEVYHIKGRDANETLHMDMCVKKCENGSIPFENIQQFVLTKKNMEIGANFECSHKASSERHIYPDQNSMSPTIYKCSTGKVDLDDTINPMCKYRAEQYPIALK
jgi:hypothetical protein